MLEKKSFFQLLSFPGRFLIELGKQGRFGGSRQLSRHALICSLALLLNAIKEGLLASRLADGCTHAQSEKKRKPFYFLELK